MHGFEPLKTLNEARCRDCSHLVDSVTTSPGLIVASSGVKSAPCAARRHIDTCDPTVRGSASWPIAKSTVLARLCLVSGRPAGQTTGIPTQRHTADWHSGGHAPATLVAVG